MSADSRIYSAARKAGLIEPQRHQVTGNAAISLDFRNMPKGVKMKSKVDGDLFSKVRVARGRAMPLADQEG